MIIEFQEVTKTFIQGDTRKDVIKNLNLKIKDNSSTLIIGPAGAGKSTLISLASLMLEPTSGKLFINNKNTSDLMEDDKSFLRRKEIGIIYQRDNLFPFLNLVENVSVPMLSNDSEKAVHLLKKMGFDDTGKCPQELSSLDDQKVTLARALINEPDILLLDEPTGELNDGETEEYMSLVKDFTDKNSVLMVTDHRGLREYFDRVFLLDEGTLH